MEQKTPLIWNPILRQYLVNAPHRMNRREGTTQCPFCADIIEGRVGPETQAWLHPNDFPMLQPPVGEAYVVIYSRDHERTFTQLTIDEVYTVTRLWRDLYTDLAQRYPTVMIFENSGTAIGQTQFHPHGQAFGVSVIPPTLERELETVVIDAAAGRGCPFCRVQQELTASDYEVATNESWQVFLPPFVRYPYETHFYPRRHVANLAQMEDQELHDLAEMLLRVIKGYNALADGEMAPMPYLLGLHQLADERFHFHIEIQAIGRAPGKLKYAASSEGIWGMWSNDSSPMQKAQELRQAIQNKEVSNT
ncbi:UDPglucose--hexose-1-phosphate uridylyltransferase [Thermosporothrix hazakensis]|jgi:UDPglucose--hexose-1-phosphate uridylyltransferase|uniref:Galactose-1-phosphate uridylyltransferase n=2 Tax=Thermosporothrix TaxID=768650 RepID=A0A326U2I2_THEHA|nr:galactose-1-phosphate uridylyltransferase [Thermosporothrix hazakensis]PZW24833.1 UDPglucose--hexose-1-phosphate uridylyltransferase [Thermosporothrix hazakensis]BBH88290.1 galactose-1-phosphate uridylyltransferase [Thermosporothrix sp. COM3]GCE46477.1 galactose-1-phosphate uridylyltransferase [Thermosporothrix hazakensis]